MDGIKIRRVQDTKDKKKIIIDGETTAYVEMLKSLANHNFSVPEPEKKEPLII